MTGPEALQALRERGLPEHETAVEIPEALLDVVPTNVSFKAPPRSTDTERRASFMQFEHQVNATGRFAPEEPIDEHAYQSDSIRQSGCERCSVAQIA